MRILRALPKAILQGHHVEKQEHSMETWRQQEED